MCRIAEVLIRLQQSGNVQYIRWRMCVACHKDLVDDLQRQAKDMEDELEKWDREVALARKDFYELNYYTTRQLLVLRNGLKLPEKYVHQSRQVKALLQSISSEITQTALANVVHEIALEDVKLGVHSPGSADLEVESSTEASPSMASSPLSSLLLAEQSVSDGKPSEANIERVGLLQENLGVDQKVHFTNIQENFGYCEMTALKAIEAVEGGDWNDIVNWLEKNGDQWEEIFQEAQGVEDTEMSEDEPVSDDETALTQAEIGKTLSGLYHMHCKFYFLCRYNSF